MLPKLILKVVAGLILAIFAVVFGTAFRVWWVAREDDHPHSDAIVVLGASQFDGRPSEVFKYRLTHALNLWQEGVATRIITLGGKRPGDRFTEAQAGANYLREHGVTDVIPVGVGNDTLQSLKALKKEFVTMGWHSAVIVTDPWHCLRSRRMAQDLGIDAHTSPTRSGPAVHTRGTEFRYIARETIAYLYYRIFHRSGDPGPNAV